MAAVKKVDKSAVPPEPPPLSERKSRGPEVREEPPPQTAYKPPGPKAPKMPAPGAETLIKGAQRIAGAPYADKEMVGIGLDEKHEGMAFNYLLEGKPGGFKALGGLNSDTRFVVGRYEYAALAEFDNKANALKAAGDLSLIVEGKCGVVRYQDPSRGGMEHFLVLTPSQMARLSQQSWELPVNVEIL